MVNRVALGLAALATASVAVAGCGSSSSGGDNPTVSTTGTPTNSPVKAALAGCSPSTLQTVKANTLTLAADKPVYEPWFVNNDPTNGKGYEDAVAYAIAKELGYTDTQVKWTRITFNQAISPAKKNFDFDLDEFSITPAREKAVDFSAPYYNVVQTVVALKGSKGAAVTSLAGLKGLKLGAQIGTTSQTAISALAPSKSPGIYQSNADAVEALKNGQIDGLVVDLPTAFYITSAQLQNAKIVGQLPASGGKQEQFGALLDKNSPLTSCVSKAVNALQADGSLAKIQDKWLAQVGKAPVLQ